MCPHGIYQCQSDPDGRERWLALAVSSDAQWDALCTTAAGAAFTEDDRFSTLLNRRRHEEDLNQLISQWTAAQSAPDLAAQLQAGGVPASLVHDGQDMCEGDPHLQERGYYRFLDHAETGRSLYDGPIVKLHRTPGELTAPAPLFGEHTFDVASEVLGYSAEEIAELTASGVFS